ncbi:uncharacterized protein METZ01_LOCUS501669, partial [marine metagenome]
MKKLLLLLLIVGCEENSTEPEDCSGFAGGTAVLDECGNCVGGYTGLIACTQDCEDVEVKLWNRCYNIETTQAIGIEGGLPEIPPEIGQLINLKYLGLENNQIKGEIPPEIGQLDNLEYLFLSNNQLTGGIPSEIGNLPNLQVLALGYNQLTGSVPSEIGNLINLFDLWLADNQLTGTIPEEICNLSLNWDNSSNLNISNNQLCPPYPSCIE